MLTRSHCSPGSSLFGAQNRPEAVAPGQASTVCQAAGMHVHIREQKEHENHLRKAGRGFPLQMWGGGFAGTGRERRENPDTSGKQGPESLGLQVLYAVNLTGMLKHRLPALVPKIMFKKLGWGAGLHFNKSPAILTSNQCCTMTGNLQLELCQVQAAILTTSTLLMPTSSSTYRHGSPQLKSYLLQRVTPAPPRLSARCQSRSTWLPRPCHLEDAAPHTPQCITTLSDLQ
jgi:hypothetical protein